MLREFPQLTFLGSWLPAVPAGMTGLHSSVVPGGHPEPRRLGVASSSSAPLPSVFIDGSQSTGTKTGSLRSTRNSN